MNTGGTWLVLGSSDNGERDYRALKPWLQSATVITTNRGIFWEPTPDVYLLFDMVACELFAGHAKEAAGRGCHCVTFAKPPDELARRGVDWMPERVAVVAPPPHQRVPQHGRTIDLGLSGLYCIQYALNQGQAERVFIVGCEGYRPNAAYFDGTPQLPAAASKTETRITPCMRAFPKEWPRTQFHLIGDIQYYVTAPNLRIWPSAQDYIDHESAVAQTV